MGQVVLKVDEDQYEQLKAIRQRDGAPVAVSVRRALEAYLKDKLAANSNMNKSNNGFKLG